MGVLKYALFSRVKVPLPGKRTRAGRTAQGGGRHARPIKKTIVKLCAEHRLDSRKGLMESGLC